MEVLHFLAVKGEKITLQSVFAYVKKCVKKKRSKFWPKLFFANTLNVIIILGPIIRV